MLNKVSGIKKSNKTKLKATSEKERTQLNNNHFKELLGNPTPIPTYNESIEQINDQLDIKTGLFTAYELRKSYKNIQNGKAIGLDEIPVEVWKLDELQEFLVKSCNSVSTQEVIEKWKKRMYIVHYFFLKKEMYI